MAEIPTFRERGAVDAAGGPAPYAAARAGERAGEIALTVDGRRLAVEPISQTACYRPGAGRPARAALRRLVPRHRRAGVADGDHPVRGRRRDATATGSAGTSW